MAINCYNFLIFLCVSFVLASESYRVIEEEAFYSSKPPPAIYAFGDSLTDTGNAVEAFPFYADCEHLPYGSKFFHAPSGRFSNGRLIVDFIAAKLGHPFLEPYFSNIIPNYHHGINFAFAGATARNVTEPVPFFLPFQINQFIRFKSHVVAAAKSKEKLGLSHLPPVESFQDGLYIIFIGINDIGLSLFTDGQPPSTVKDKIVPEVTVAISNAVQDLFGEGARKFLVINIPTIGCLPAIMALASSGPLNSTDEIGCMKAYNDLVDFANLGIEKILSELSSKLQHVHISIGDLYGFIKEAIRHPTKYGFTEKTKFRTCCGYGDNPYNYNPNISCGTNPEAKACNKPDEYMSWDGIHFTDAFSQRFVKEMMKGRPYLRPPTPALLGGQLIHRPQM